MDVVARRLAEQDGRGMVHGLVAAGTALLLSVAALGAGEVPAYAPTPATVEALEYGDIPAAAWDGQMSLEQRARAIYNHFGLDSSFFDIVITDDLSLNCGGEGGGCTRMFPTRPVVYISPKLEDSPAFLVHILLHEYKHATGDLNECDAENFSHQTWKSEQIWLYPECVGL